MRKLSFLLLIPLFLLAFKTQGQTVISYNMGDGSAFTNDGVQWNSVTSTTSPDGLLRTQAATSKWHSAGYGVSFRTTNSLEIDVTGTVTVRFYGSIYSDAAGTMSGGTTLGGNDLGIQNIKVAVDKTGYYEFSYVGGPKTLYFTRNGSGECYTPVIDVMYPYKLYNLGDGSTFTNDGVQWNPVTSTTSPDGKLRTQAATSRWHSSGYGVSFRTGNSLQVDVTGPSATVRFYGSIYSDAAGTISGGTTVGGNELGVQNIKVAVDKTGYYEFSYVGGPRTLYFTRNGSGECYTPQIVVTNLAASIIKSDVWDFGAQQLDEVLYNNMLNETKINAWYSGVTPGTTATVLPTTWTEGVLSWVGGTNDRLRTSNTNLTRYDTNLGGAVGYIGRIYQNGTNPTAPTTPSRYMQLTLDEDDEVKVMMLTQSGGGVIHFQNVANPGIQDDVVNVGTTLQEVKFVSKAAGQYRIYDAVDKPSFFRIYRKDAQYTTITGVVNETNAPGVPNGYSINFTNQAGKTFSAVVSSGTYTIDLPVEYTYDVSLGNANGYVIASDLSLTATETTTNFNVTIVQVDLHTVSGNITGLPNLSNLTLTYTPDPLANKIYNPIISINTTNSTYSVDLEANVEYTISAGGVNDYEILSNTITITGTQTADIVFTQKPLHNITINTPDLDVTQRGKLSLTFTNLNESGYVYTFTDVSTVALRDGVYKMTYSGLDEYPIELALTSNLSVSGSNVVKDLVFKPVTEWVFNDRNISAATAYKGLVFTGSVNVRGTTNGDLNASSGATIAIPVHVGDKVLITDYYASNYTIDGVQTVTNTSNSTGTKVIAEYVYPGVSDGFVNLAISGTTYLLSIKVLQIVPYSATITVGTGKDYQTINEALDAISRMDRPSNERVTVLIDPDNYEEMIVIKSANVTLKNAATTPSIALLNKGVDIDANAVRITSYYGQKYNFFSQASDNKWNADVLAVNKANGYTLYENKEGTGGGSSYWNATVVVEAVGFTAENIILENSFNQYISLKESQDVVQPKGGDPVRPTTYGNVTVQDRSLGYVTQAAAIGIAASADKVLLNNCRVIGRQDSFYGAGPSRVVVYKGAMMGAVDYLYGAMNAVFYKTDLVLNTSDSGSDVAYITAAQQSSGRGYLMYQCHVKSPVPGVETASINGSKPGYFGRPWSPNTSEVVFFETTIDASTYPGNVGQSLIVPAGWNNTLGGSSAKMYERSTVEVSGENNASSRASWSTVLTQDQLTDGTAITTFNFTKGNDNWDPISELNALGVEDQYPNQSSVKVVAYNGNIYISNVTSNTQVNIYSVTGALVKSVTTKSDTNFNIQNGLWIIKIKDEVGKKVIKLVSH
ncbi:hypothetical protein ACFQ1R_08315 [Mariniflexile jejuense]|uniref:Pectinesterase catalytic domain-containing protein n=1 Tax=Mariniflexile jejuense TaxID=1173582 RepID=A0ABW3JHX9_9FLAO